jgi:hypothetical protein
MGRPGCFSRSEIRSAVWQCYAIVYGSPPFTMRTFNDLLDSKLVGRSSGCPCPTRTGAASSVKLFWSGRPGLHSRLRVFYLQFGSIALLRFAGRLPGVTMPALDYLRGVRLGHHSIRILTPDTLWGSSVYRTHGRAWLLFHALTLGMQTGGALLLLLLRRADPPLDHGLRCKPSTSSAIPGLHSALLGCTCPARSGVALIIVLAWSGRPGLFSRSGLLSAV